MVPVVAALLLRKSRSGYIFVFTCFCVCVGVRAFLGLCVCVCGLVDVYSIYVWLYVCEENEIIKIERVREWIPFNKGKMQAVSPVFIFQE